MNISKSMGLDGCHPRLVRETADIISTPLETVFDKTFNERKVPDIWKDANVSALYKNKGDKCELYRINRANRLLGLIKRTFKALNSELFLTLYKTLIRSIIDYGGSVYFPSTKKNIQLLENIQRRATRIVPQLRGLNYQD